ncbi:MAG: hypothetical protein ACI85O_001345 [Saprospiraceae bacterium]|jgi:hypothetical protein
MKINTKNVIVAFLLIMSLTSYIFLSNVKVNEPSPLNQTELQEEYLDNAEIPTNLTMPDLGILERVLDVLTKVIVQ